jgi:hypothetical protein
MADPDNDNDTASQSSSQTSYCWSNTREMQVVISSYLKFPNDPWTDRKVKSEEVQLSRDVLTHMAGGQNHVVPMLKSILNENEHIALTAIKQEETVKEESQTWEGSPSLLEQEAPPGSGGPLCNSDNETLIGDDFYDNEEIQEVEEIPQKSSRQIRVKKNSDISYKSQYRRPTRVARSKSVLESCSSSQETTGSQFLGSQDSDYENDGQESELEISLQPGAAGSDDPQHELNNETIQSDDSRNTCLLDEEEIPDLLDDPPQKDNDIELKLMQTKNLHVENDDEIPDFEETASNDNSENCSPLALIRTSTPLLNTLLRQRKRSTSRSNTPLLRKRSRGLSKPTIEDPIEENIEDEIEVLEQEVEPSSMSVNVDEDEENEIPEEDDDVRKVKHSRTKSPKPGKQSLLEVMREMIGADIDITDDEVFERFQFKSTLYKKEGFVQHYCPCKMENDIIQHIFRLEPEFPTGTEYRKDVDICPKCFLQYARAGKSEDRTNFLNMVYQVSTSRPYISIYAFPQQIKGKMNPTTFTHNQFPTSFFFSSITKVYLQHL